MNHSVLLSGGARARGGGRGRCRAAASGFLLELPVSRDLLGCAEPGEDPLASWCRGTLGRPVRPLLGLGGWYGLAESRASGPALRLLSDQGKSGHGTVQTWVAVGRIEAS